MRSSFKCSLHSHTVSYVKVRPTRVAPTFCLHSKPSSMSSVSLSRCLTVLTEIQLVWVGVVDLLLGQVMRAVSVRGVQWHAQQRDGPVALGLMHRLVWLSDGDDIGTAPYFWNSLAGHALDVEIPQPV